MPVILRNLPFHFEKSHITNILQKSPLSKSVLNVEELIVLNEKKHTMIVFSDIDSALYSIKHISHKLKDFILIRANLHPDYTK